MDIYNQFFKTFREELPSEVVSNYRDSLLQWYIIHLVTYINSNHSITAYIKSDYSTALQDKLESYPWLKWLFGGALPEQKASIVAFDYDFFEKLINHISTIKLLNSPCLGSWRTIDVIKVVYDLAQEHKAPSFIITDEDLEYSADEYYQVMSGIEIYSEYSSYYKSDGPTIDKLEKYNHQTLLSKDMDSLRESVQKMASRLEHSVFSLRQYLISHKDSELENLQNETDVELNYYLSLTNDILSYIDQYGGHVIHKPSLISFDTLLKNRFDTWTKLLKKYDLKYQNDPITLYKESIVNRSSISKQNRKRRKDVFNNVKHINSINANDKSTVESINEIIDVVKQINSLQIFKTSFELNSRALIQVIQMTESIIKELQIFNNIPHIQSALKWHEVKESLPKSILQVFPQLEYSSISKWKLIIEYFYLSMTLDNKFSFTNTVENDAIIDFDKMKDHLLARANFKVSDFSLEKILTSKQLVKRYKSKTDISASEVWENENQESVFSYLSNFDDKEEFSINLDSKHYNTHHSSESHDKFGVGSSIDIITAIAKTTVSKQLPIAEYLANALFPYIDHIRAFQAKECNIISLLNAHWQDNLEVLLPISSPKEFFILQPEHLTDFFLVTDRPLYFLIQDSLINLEMKFIFHQWSLLQDLQKAGINIINIQSIHLTQGPIYLNETIVKSMKHSTSNLQLQESIDD